MKHFLTTAFLMFFNLATTVCCLGAENSWHSSFLDAQREAQATGRPILIHFYSPACGPCRMMNRDVFSQQEVTDLALKYYVPVKVDIWQDKQTASRFRISAVPAEIIASAEGVVLERRIGAVNLQKYKAFLSNAALNHKIQLIQKPALQELPLSEPSLKENAILNEKAVLNQAVIPQEVVVTSQANEIVSPPKADPVENTIINEENSAASHAQPVTEASRQMSGFARPVSGTYPTDLIKENSTEISSSELTRHSLPRTVTQDISPENNVSETPFIPAAANHGSVQSAEFIPDNEINAGVITSDYVPKGDANIITDTPDNHKAVANPVKQESPSYSPSLKTQSPSAVALDGYCCVALVEQHTWIAGKPELGVVHRGRIYYFSSEENRKKFFINPDFYAPAISGHDIVSWMNTERLTPGFREYGLRYNGINYLFSSAENLEKFRKDPEFYASPLREALQNRHEYR